MHEVAGRIDTPRVDNARLREQFEASVRAGLDPSELCQLLGITSMKKSPHNGQYYPCANLTSLYRQLGIKYTKSAGDKKYFNKTIKADLALKIMYALGLDPVDVDL